MDGYVLLRHLKSTLIKPIQYIELKKKTTFSIKQKIKNKTRVSSAITLNLVGKGILQYFRF